MKILLVQWGAGKVAHFDLFNANSREFSAYYGVPHCALRSALKRRNIDLLPHEAFSANSKADALICIDLPAKRSDLQLLIDEKVSIDAPLILVAEESAHSRPELLSIKELTRWDHVFHYSSLLPESDAITHYCLPSNLPFLRFSGPCFKHDKVRLIGMMGTNKPSRRSNPQTWFPIKAMNGYQLSVSDLKRWFRLEDGLRLRRYWAYNLSLLIPSEFRVFGGQWDGLPYSPIHRIVNPKPNSCSMGYSKANPISIIKGFKFFFASENLIGDPGYLTEKLFNVIRAGSVPIIKSSTKKCAIQQAAERIGLFYIDLKNYSSPAALLNKLNCIDCAEYDEMKYAGKMFLRSEAARRHTVKSYSSLMCNALVEIMEGRKCHIPLTGPKH